MTPTSSPGRIEILNGVPIYFEVHESGEHGQRRAGKGKSRSLAALGMTKEGRRERGATAFVAWVFRLQPRLVRVHQNAEGAWRM